MESKSIIVAIRLGLGFDWNSVWDWDLIGILIAIAVGILLAIAIGVGIAIEIRVCLRDMLSMRVERNHLFLISEVESRSFQSKCSKNSCNVAFDEKL